MPKIGLPRAKSTVQHSTTRKATENDVRRSWVDQTSRCLRSTCYQTFEHWDLSPRAQTGIRGIYFDRYTADTPGPHRGKLPVINLWRYMKLVALSKGSINFYSTRGAW